jgi:hypothetical protein
MAQYLQEENGNATDKMSDTPNKNRTS